MHPYGNQVIMTMSLRKEELLKEVARYILENPVRKGLVDNFKEYPFLGSRIFDITEL